MAADGGPFLKYPHQGSNHQTVSGKAAPCGTISSVKGGVGRPHCRQEDDDGRWKRTGGISTTYEIHRAALGSPRLNLVQFYHDLKLNVNAAVRVSPLKASSLRLSS